MGGKSDIDHQCESILRCMAPFRVHRIRHRLVPVSFNASRPYYVNQTSRTWSRVLDAQENLTRHTHSSVDREIL